MPSSGSSPGGRGRPLLRARICDISLSTSSPSRPLPRDRARSRSDGGGATSGRPAGLLPSSSPPSTAPSLGLPRLRARSCDSRSCMRASTSSFSVRLAVAAALSLRLRPPYAPAGGGGLASLSSGCCDDARPRSPPRSAPYLPAGPTPDERRGTIALAISPSLSSLRTLRSSPLSLLSEYSLSIVLTLSSSVSCCCSIMILCSSIFSSRSFVLSVRRRSASSS